RDKVPSIKGGKGSLDATTDPAKLSELLATSRGTNGYGVALNDLIVVDIDGDEAFATLEALDLPKTWLVRTPTGGHLYFKRPPGVELGRKIRVADKLDVLGDGYVVGPGSVRSDGGAYEWLYLPESQQLADL